MIASRAFGKERRLLAAREFDAVFKNAAYRISTREFLMLAIETDRSASRVGTVVSKRNAGNIVGRNRLRRLIKESFRLEWVDPGLDVVIISRPGARELGNVDVREVLSGMWVKLANKRKQASMP